MLDLSAPGSALNGANKYLEVQHVVQASERILLYGFMFRE